MTEQSVFVYFISAGSGPIKIGISGDPHERINNLQTAHYKRLHLLFSIECPSIEDARKLERAFHRWYDELKLLNEWYDVTPSRIQSDIELLSELSRSALAFHVHTETKKLMKLEQRAVERKLTANTARKISQHSDKVIQAVKDATTDSEGVLSIGCPYCEWSGRYDNEPSARFALTAHLRKHPDKEMRVYVNGHVQAVEA